MASKVASDLEVVDLKQSNLFKAYEELHSQASRVMVFSLQWKDLEKHFELSRESLRTGLQRLSEREKAVVSREREVEARELRFESEFSSKQNHLARMEKLIGERVEEITNLQSLIQENVEDLEAKRGHCALVQMAIVQRHEELGRLQDCIGEEEAKNERVKSFVKRAEEKLLSLERRVKQKSCEAETKEKEVDSIRKMWRRCKDDIESNEKTLQALRRSVDEGKKEVESQEKRIRDCCLIINQSEKDIKSREEKHNTIKNSILERANELALKEKRLELVQRETKLKEENFVSLKNSMDRCAKAFDRKEREIHVLLKFVEEKEKSCESRHEEAHLIESRVNTCLKEVESREIKVEALQELVQKDSLDLQTKERQFRESVREFELRQRDSNSSRKATEVKIEPVERVEANTSIVPPPPCNQKVDARDGKNMQLILNLQLQKHDIACNEAYGILRASSDPAKFVLEAMEGFYPSESKTKEFDVRIIRRSCILLLEKLMELAPQINSKVKDEAKNLANDWIVKSKLGETNYLEASGIVQLVNSYGLASEVNLNDFCRLLDSVGRHGESLELRQALSNSDQALVVHNNENAAASSLANLMTSLSHVPLSDVHVKISKFLETLPDPASHVLTYIRSLFSQNWNTGYLATEYSIMRHCVCLFEQLLRISQQIQTHVSDCAKKLAIQWNGKIQINCESPWYIFAFLQFLHTYGLFTWFDNTRILKFLKIISLSEDKLRFCRALSFADTIPGFIQNLIQRRNPVDAVRLIYAFNLNNNGQFSPVSILNSYVNDVKYSSNGKKLKGKTVEEKEKATNEEIAALESVIRCVRDYAPRLQGIPVGQLSNRIGHLHKIKKQRREAQQSCLVKTQQEQKPHQDKPNHVMKKRGHEALHHQCEPRNGRFKFQRTSTASDRLHPAPVAFEVPINPSSGIASVQCGYSGSKSMGFPNLDGPRHC